MKDRRATATTARTIGIFLMVLPIVLSVSPASAGSRICAKTTMTESFVLPGGLEHPPGELMLCHHLEYSPSKMLMLTYVDHAPTGLLMGRRGEGESTTTRDPFMMFARDASGRLHLYGYAMPRRGGLETFTLEVAPGPGGSAGELAGPARVVAVEAPRERAARIGANAPVVFVPAVAR